MVRSIPTPEVCEAALKIALPAELSTDFPDPTPTGFFSLPPELRLNVYHDIIAMCSIDLTSISFSGKPNPELWFLQDGVDQQLPTSHRLATFRGLIMSDSLILNEFEVEWLKVFITMAGGGGHEQRAGRPNDHQDQRLDASAHRHQAPRARLVRLP